MFFILHVASSNWSLTSILPHTLTTFGISTLTIGQVAHRFITITSKFRLWCLYRNCTLELRVMYTRLMSSLKATTKDNVCINSNGVQDGGTFGKPIIFLYRSISWKSKNITAPITTIFFRIRNALYFEPLKWLLPLYSCQNEQHGRIQESGTTFPENFLLDMSIPQTLCGSSLVMHSSRKLSEW